MNKSGARVPLVPAFKHSGNSTEFAFSYLHFAVSTNVAYATRIEAVKQITTLLQVDETRASSFLILAILSILALHEQPSTEIDYAHDLKTLVARVQPPSANPEQNACHRKLGQVDCGCSPSPGSY